MDLCGVDSFLHVTLCQRRKYDIHDHPHYCQCLAVPHILDPFPGHYHHPPWSRNGSAGPCPTNSIDNDIDDDGRVAVETMIHTAETKMLKLLLLLG